MFAPPIRAAPLHRLISARYAFAAQIHAHTPSPEAMTTEH